MVALVLFAFAACSQPARAPAPAGLIPPAAAAPADSTPRLVAIDMFGTRQITQDQLLAKLGTDLRQFADASMKGDSFVDPEPLLGKLFALGDFEEVTLSPVGYPNKRGPTTYYLTVDFVDKADAARRMPFTSSPTGTYPDPDGLLEDWHAYEQEVLQHFDRRVDCPAYHCLGNPTLSPRLQELANKFASRAPAHLDELATILRDDHDVQHRTAAAFLLAYAKDGAWLMTQLVPAFRDSEPVVRNNAMRVTADIAAYHPEVEIPVEPMLAALDYPSTSDRNKSAAILDRLLSRSDSGPLRSLIATHAGATLLAMLRLEQPNNHDFAYRILQKVSGKSFGERDYASWEAWLHAQPR